MRQIIIATLIMFCSLSTGYAVEPPTSVPIDKDGVQRVAIVGGDYYFKPGHIIVKVNVPVELDVRKDTFIVPHDIIIDAPEAGIRVKESLSRDSKAIRFTPTKTGSYAMFCDKKPPFLASHRKKGMEGLLEVVE